MNTRLAITKLSKKFTLHTQGGVTLSVLDGIDLTVSGGECVVLRGPSGAGKSTLLRCIYGNYLSGSGAIRLCHGETDIDIAMAGSREILSLRRKTLGYVTQFLRVVPRVSTVDVVSEPLRALGVPPRKAVEKAKTLLSRLAIPERLWQLAPATFSGGERQRINVARGFIVDYPVLLLDEPTAALDAENRRTVVSLIREATERGAAVLGIFHDAEIRDAVATRIVEISATSEAV